MSEEKRQSQWDKATPKERIGALLLFILAVLIFFFGTYLTKAQEAEEETPIAQTYNPYGVINLAGDIYVIASHLYLGNSFAIFRSEEEEPVVVFEFPQGEIPVAWNPYGVVSATSDKHQFHFYLWNENVLEHISSWIVLSDNWSDFTPHLASDKVAWLDRETVSSGTESETKYILHVSDFAGMNEAAIELPYIYVYSLNRWVGESSIELEVVNGEGNTTTVIFSLATLTEIHSSYLPSEVRSTSRHEVTFDSFHEYGDTIAGFGSVEPRIVGDDGRFYLITEARDEVMWLQRGEVPSISSYLHWNMWSFALTETEMVYIMPSEIYIIGQIFSLDLTEIRNGGYPVPQDVTDKYLPR